jgi:hypothetical protein
MNRQVLKYFFTVVALLGTTGGWAQNPPIDNLIGVYSTKEDFIANKISYQHERDAANDLKVDVNENILLRHEGVIRKIKHQEVFGYYYQGQKYVAYGVRKSLFTDIGYYKVEDEGILLIYSIQSYRGNGNQSFYLYSRTIDSPVKRLTFRNIKNEFHDQPEFIVELKKYKSVSRDRFNMKDADDDHKVINNLLKKYYCTTN